MTRLRPSRRNKVLSQGGRGNEKAYPETYQALGNLLRCCEFLTPASAPVLGDHDAHPLCPRLKPEVDFCNIENIVRGLLTGAV